MHKPIAIITMNEQLARFFTSSQIAPSRTPLSSLSTATARYPQIPVDLVVDQSACQILF